LVVLFPKLTEILCEIQTLNTFDDHQAAKAAAHLENELQKTVDEIHRLLSFPEVVEILQPAPLSITEPSFNHKSCCPPPPFIPHRLQYPPAGAFRMAIYAMQCYLRSVLYPAIRAKRDPNKTTRLRGADPLYYCYEICKTYAGMEDYLDNNPDAMIPLFSLLMMSMTSCDDGLRAWLWSKLHHFEQLGYPTFDSTKRYFAMLLNIPQIITEGFSRPLPDHVARDICCDDIIAAVNEICRKWQRLGE
jgi:hypothetical protein